MGFTYLMEFRYSAFIFVVLTHDRSKSNATWCIVKFPVLQLAIHLCLQSANWATN